MTQKLDGRVLSQEIRAQVGQRVSVFRDKRGIQPGLAIVQVGHDPASNWYVRQIRRAAERVGIRCDLQKLNADTTQDTLESALRLLALDSATHGVMLQLPLPAPLDSRSAINMLDPRKDVDGVHPLNAGSLFQDSGAYLTPATPAGGMALLERAGVPIAGANAVVVGRSTIVGRPMAMLLLHRNATVTLCHSRTRDLAAQTRRADILTVAVGRPGIITGEMVKPGAVVIDFGVNVVDGTLLGDVNAETVEDVAGWLTPVPGGTGPMTTAMLLQNTISAAEQQSLE